MSDAFKHNQYAGVSDAELITRSRGHSHFVQELAFRLERANADIAERGSAAAMLAEAKDIAAVQEQELQRLRDQLQELMR